MTAKKNIHQRLAKVMSEVTYLQKEKKSGMRFSIVSHDKVTALVRPALLNAGIVYYPVRCDHTHNGNRAECGMTIRFVNVDDPADIFEVQTFGYGVDNQDKGPGMAMSYAVKYALLKALGLETGDDPDQNDIDHTRDDPAAKPEKTPAEKFDWFKQVIESKTDAIALDAFWNKADFKTHFDSMSPEFQAKLQAIYDARKAELSGPTADEMMGAG